MGFFSLIKSFFSKDKVQVVINLAKTILLTMLGQAAADLEKTALEEVKKAEATGKEGLEKYKMVWDAITSKVQYKDLPKWVLTFIIELCVGLVDPKVSK